MTAGSGSRKARETPGGRTTSRRTSAITTWSARYPSFGNLVPRDVASRAAKEVCDEGRGVGPGGTASTSTSARPSAGWGWERPREVRQPLRDLRAHHRRRCLRCADAYLPGPALHDGRAVGRLPPDVHHSGALRRRRSQLLRSGRQPARRSALMRAFPTATSSCPPRCPTIWPRRIWKRSIPRTQHSARRGGGSQADRQAFLKADGRRTVDSFHRELGRLMWDNCGMARIRRGSPAGAGQNPRAARGVPRQVRVLGDGEELNQSLEKAGRVADFLEVAELMCTDALHRTSLAAATSAWRARPLRARLCATTPNFTYVAAWEWRGQARLRHCTRSR